MRIAHIDTSITHIKTSFKSIIQADNTLITKNSLSWTNIQSGIVKDVTYFREYKSLLDRQQYSFLFIDDSFIQFYYNFSDSGVLNKAKLAYYPKPIDTKDDIDQLYELYDSYEGGSHAMTDSVYDMINDFEMGEKPINTSHLRIDYDSSAKSHSKAHLQFGGINNFRLDANGIPLPFAFMHTIAENFFIIQGLKIHSGTSYYRSALTHAHRRCYMDNTFKVNSLFLASHKE